MKMRVKRAYTTIVLSFAILQTTFYTAIAQADALLRAW